MDEKKIEIATKAAIDKLTKSNAISDPMVVIAKAVAAAIAEYDRQKAE